MLKLLVLPITWLGFYALDRLLNGQSITRRRYSLAIVSLVLLLLVTPFETWLLFVSLTAGVILMGYALSQIRNETSSRGTYILSILSIVILIVVFLKWRVYFQKHFVYLPSLSYLGFRAIALLTSVYKRRSFDFSTGLIQMVFFPMLFMGPISRAENFEKECRDYADILPRLSLGLFMLILGHFSGLYVLNNVRHLVDVHWSMFWLGALANSFEFYFTFAGYSHLIIGLGLLVGFKLPENFNNPYCATSISDFWGRWHISLSYWIRDYVYIPLGGSRRGIARKCLNLVVAMGLCGIWHGLSINFLLWGLFHGTLMALESLVAFWGLRLFPESTLYIPKPIKVLSTFTLVSFSWLLFKYPIPEFVLYMKGMTHW